MIGTDMSVQCPNCQATNRPQANFCATCGYHLARPAANDESPTSPIISPAPDGFSPEEAQTVPMSRSLDLRVGRRTHVGRRRGSNEDSLLVLDYFLSNKSTGRPVGLFVVADGIGGHEGGEIASGMLVRTVARRAATWLAELALSGEPPGDAAQWLTDIIRGANREIYAWARQVGYEMGTTIVAALINGEHAVIAHVGDSRAYCARAAALERLTVDHSLVESLVNAHQISAEEARDHPQSNVILRTIGDQADVEVDVNQLRLAPGELLLLCSDGLSGMLTDEAIHHLLSAEASPQAVCDALVDAANRAGGEDNITAIVVSLVAVERLTTD
jgi:protein phosphatase